MTQQQQERRQHLSYFLLLLLCCCQLTICRAFLFHQLHLQNSNQTNAGSRQQSDQLSTSDLQFVGGGGGEAFEAVQLNDEVADCPRECDCVKVAQIADCSNRSLTRVPNRWPRDIRRIRLERNNISELGPFAFRNLRRLQRIDLSNNKLVKIDPLAFSGGLQSLTSLILFGNRLSQLPVQLFSELSQLQLLLLNTNQLRCIQRELFQSLTNLNLLSLYDNNIETLSNGTFDGLKSIKTIHLAKNPLLCDCNLRWLADYLETNPIETSEARCEAPPRNQAKRLSQLSQQRFRCEVGDDPATPNQCSVSSVTGNSLTPQPDQSCPSGCLCSGSTIDCSRLPQSELQPSIGASSVGQSISGLPPLLELPADIPDDVPVYVTRMRINDNRIKRIRQTALFRRLANSQKLDLGNNKIVDIEDNHINGGPKPERVVFVLLENEHCTQQQQQQHQQQQQQPPEDPCSSAPKVNPPTFDSPCYNGGSCFALTTATDINRPYTTSSNYSCNCPPGFAGPLCEINIDDCAQHQCQNGAMCIDGINTYRCLCRDPTTTGEYCEQLNSLPLSALASSPSSLSGNSIAPVALPIIAAAEPQQQISTRSADFKQPTDIQQQPQIQQQLSNQQQHLNSCKRITKRTFYQDGNGCQSVRVLKLSECAGTCGTSGCCMPAKVRRRRIRMQCNDGASYVKTIDLVKKCACSNECSLDEAFQQQLQQFNHHNNHHQLNATQEDQLLQITRLDAVD